MQPTPSTAATPRWPARGDRATFDRRPVTVAQVVGRAARIRFPSGLHMWVSVEALLAPGESMLAPLEAPSAPAESRCSVCGARAWPEWRLYEYGAPVDFCGRMHREQHLHPRRPLPCSEPGCQRSAMDSTFGRCAEHAERPLRDSDVRLLAEYGVRPCCAEMRRSLCVCSISVRCRVHPQASRCYGSHD